MAVFIENSQDKYTVDDGVIRLINEAVKLSLEAEGFDRPSEISVVLVDNDEIRDINREHRSVDSATDVLSFPMAEMKDGDILSDTGDLDMDENLLLLGDIVISLERAAEQAGSYGHSFERELCFLVTHGMYHLLGYDHETPEDEAVMMGRQEAVLESMGVHRGK